MHVKERYKDELVAIITKYLPDAKIYLYGSRARGTHRNGSDIDLAVDTGAKVDWKMMMKIEDEIDESTIPLFVDVIDIHDVGKKFLEEIRSEWIIWR